MGTLLHYSMEVAMLLTALFLIYRWTLATATFHRFNRGVLLCGYAMALLVFPLARLGAGAEAAPAQEAIIEQIQEAVTQLRQEPEPWWPDAIAYVYAAGVAVALALTVRSAMRIRSIVRGGSRSKAGKYTLVRSGAKGLSPFSWGSYIVVPQSASAEDLPAIIAHETAHLDRRHWLDLALGQAVIVLNWFNPAAYLMMKELQDVHEFEVDAHLAGTGMDMRQYQILLLRNATQAAVSSPVNRLSCSQLRVRFAMMAARRSHPLRRLAALALLPAALLTFAATHSDTIAAPLAMIESASTIFDSMPREVVYSVEGESHSIAYGSGEQRTMVSMDVEAAEPDIYIDGYKSSRARLARLKAKEINFILADNRNNRFIVTTSR